MKVFFYKKAMIDSVIGESQVNTILSSLGIPCLDDKLLKRYERVAGNAIEKCNHAKKILQKKNI